MRILMINSVCGIRSTGRICTDLARQLEAQGHEVKIAYGRENTVPEQFKKYAVRIGGALDLRLHGVRSRLLDQHGFGSKQATRAFLRWADGFDPDMVWLHNLHGYYINVELLFRWIKSRPQMQVKWTLHDCWSFTGHCTYFTAAGCDKWKTGCFDCPQKKQYPASLLLDDSRRNYKRKRKAFTGVQNMTLITPSQWLADLVGQSFLRDYPVEVRYNTIDTEVFRPTPGDFRERYGLQGKKLILGVASTWDERKGLKDFMQLAALLDENCRIVLVGLSEEQLRQCPPNVLGLGRTDSPRQLAEIYTAADVFLNPSREETFGMTTVEALACGTPAVVYKGTACEEIVRHFGGLAVDAGVGVQPLLQAIRELTACRVQTWNGGQP